MLDEIDILFEYMLDELRDLIREGTERGEMLAEVGAEPEAQHITAQIEALRGFQAKVVALRKDWSRIDLSPPPQAHGQAALPEVKASPAIPRGVRTPNQAFHLPILVALVQLGGRACMQTVLDRVHGMLKDQLNEYDYQSLPSNPHAIRWENNAQWARLMLVQQGYLHADSPRGVWEITAAGRARVGEAGSQMGTAEESGEYHTEPFDFKDQ
jgi:hypothetical protein